jgi:tripartite-type tricarboxylate transporter receptor subunit TctC
MKRWLVLACAALLPCFVAAQGFPERPVRIIVPLTPGGSPDTIARAIAQGLQGVWPQPVVVENRPGGSQNIGADLVAKSPADGYTWLLAPDNVFSVNPYLTRPPFDPLADLAPVTQVARIAFLLVVPSTLPVGSVQELVSYARAHPGELNHALRQRQPAAPRRGDVPEPDRNEDEPRAVQGRRAGGGRPAAGAHPGVDRRRQHAASAHQGRKLKPRQHRAAALRQPPGYPHHRGGRRARIRPDPWLGLFVPAKVPPDIVTRINTEVVKILGGPELRARLSAQGIELVTNSPAEFARFIHEDNAKWGKIIKDAGIKGD